MQDVIDMYLSSYNEKETFLNYLDHKSKSGKVTPSMIKKNLKKIFESHSIFSIQLINEYLCLEKKLLGKCKFFRINSPGTVGNQNWSAVLPISIEQIIGSGICAKIKEIAVRTDRI
jgi:4-alpha-glucanotransferase